MIIESWRSSYSPRPSLEVVRFSGSSMSRTCIYFCCPWYGYQLYIVRRDIVVVALSRTSRDCMSGGAFRSRQIPKCLKIHVLHDNSHLAVFATHKAISAICLPKKRQTLQVPRLDSMQPSTMSPKPDTLRIMVTATTDSVKPTGVSYHRMSTARKWQHVRHVRALSSGNHTRRARLDLLATAI